MNIIRDWFQRHFTDPQVIILIITLVLGAVVILTLGNILMPVLASMVIAYLLDGVVGKLERLKVPRIVAVMIVFLTFLAFLLLLLLGLMPKLSMQIGQMVSELPSIITRGQKKLLLLPERYPDIFSEQHALTVIRILQNELGNIGQKLLAFSLTWVQSIATFLVYLILVPFLVFFFMKDKHQIILWLVGFLPKKRHLSSQVYREVNRQIGNFIRGKFLEFIIVWVVSYATFSLLGLRFSMLISLSVGLSVLVPYVGVIVAIFPVAMVAFYQWGWDPTFAKAMIAYAIIQLVDGNLLAPLLLSEVVDLHPVAIIVAVLTFGGIWGFWGVFFAIPLATLIQAVLKAWPDKSSPANPPIDQPPSA